jgi:Domain of unknown function (DUF5655)
MRPLWRCPKCGERFISPNLWHSCGRGTYDRLFARSEPHVRRIFDRLTRIAARCGSVRVYPQKSRVVFQSRIRFAHGHPQKRQFVAGFLLPPDAASPRFSRILDGLSRHYKVCYVHLRTEADVDREVARWMRRAYRFGRQEHLR